MNNCAQHNIYNIEAGRPFSKYLARYLLRITDGQPEKLSRYRILLPTRRACRILRETFLSINNGKPLLLPVMTPIGDVDAQDLSLMMFGSSDSFLEIPNAVSPLKRQLLLAKLIKNAPEFAQGQGHALALANALAQFIDQVVVEGLEFPDLHKIVPDEFAAHWQITLDFLKIISEHWPLILAEHGLVDVAERRNLLLQALAMHWQKSPPDYPIIAAGVTGSIPAVAGLLEVIASMDNGQIILPGLDVVMDSDAWEHISENHPQYMLKNLLERINIDRTDIKGLNDDDKGRRNVLASEIILPAQVTARWKDFGNHHDIAPMLQHLQYFSCSTQQEEASLIALIMRESLQQKENVTALVTPDRALARRVSALCRRWGVEVDDSAGISLQESRLGKFMLLSMNMVHGGFDVISMLALLKISLCRFGYEDRRYNRMLNLLEIEFLRKGELFSSYEMLRDKISEKDGYGEVLEFIDRFYAALKPLKYYAGQNDGQKFADILKAHIKVMEAVATSHDKHGSNILWRGDEGESCALFLNDVLEHAELIGDVSMSEYMDIISSLMQGVTIRSAYNVHPRLLILGQLEARLSDADLVILGGLNEGVWPSDAGHDPWMSRPMRNDFGLPDVEQSIGIAAHDFVQGFCADKVVMTRSEKIDGSPSVPARWLNRLDTVMRACGRNIDDLSSAPYLDFVKILDDPKDFKPFERPKPKPPISTRPSGVSVTKVDIWLKDPYAIYMHYVLNLRKIRPLVQDNDAALRGIILHKILEDFTSKNPLELPDNAEEEFINIAKVVLEDRLESADIMHYWWVKLLRIATWFAKHEREWREGAKFFKSEVKGSINIDINGIPFNLRGTADRIDRMHGGYAIIDYKTGGSFSPKALKNGALPQLPLEAIILSEGGFENISKGNCIYLGYWKLTGGNNAGEIKNITGDLDETIETVLNGLKDLVSVFRELDTPFYAVPDTSNAPRFNDYEHVSRLKEWAALDNMEES